MNTTKEYLLIGSYEPETEEKPSVISRDYYVQGYIYKDEEAFENRPNDVCYVPELSDTLYTRNDFLDLCDGNEDYAKELFLTVDWQHPETLLEEWYVNEEIDNCPHCGYMYNAYDTWVSETLAPICVKCGGKLVKTQ
jgi:hypothetical protein